MAIYLYCLLGATTDPPRALRGIDGLPVRAVDAGGMRAWISETSENRLAPNVDRAREHDAVVRAAMAIETPLPARFGQIVADQAALEHGVASRREALASALATVAGAVEMTVKVRVDNGVAPAEPTTEPALAGEGRGRRYLERVAAAHRREQNVLAEERVIRERVREAVAPLVRAETFVGSSAGSNVVSISHLVPRDRVTAYRRAVQALRDVTPALSIRVSGPWAPYSFTQVGADE